MLRPDEWPRFDRAELEYMERRSLDEAVELFGEPTKDDRFDGPRQGIATRPSLLSFAPRVVDTCLSENSRGFARLFVAVVLYCEREYISLEG